MDVHRPHTVVIDGLNYLHRVCASGMPLASFFTCLRSTVQRLRPTRIVMAFEGRPIDRLELLPSYKANRREDQGLLDAEGLQKAQARRDLLAAANRAVDLARCLMPMAVMRHPRFEADDLINTVVMRASSATDFTIVSNDTDFLQLLDRPNVRLFSAHKDVYLTHELAGDAYVLWKALKGDAGDNVLGFEGIGPKRALQLVRDPDALARFLAAPGRKERLALNFQLIKLVELPEDETTAVESSCPTRDWEALRGELRALGVNKVTADPYWSERFVPTFDPLWG
jgi:5'-3' exonuclease